MKAAALAVLLAIALAIVVPGATLAKIADAGTWTEAPDMLAEHTGHTATLLPDGRVLIAGGSNAAGVATAECELFDPKTNRWTRAADMNSPRAEHSATLLKDGTVLVAGGQTALNTFPIDTLASVEVYHPATNSWTEAHAMPVPRARHKAVLLHDDRVLVVGGSVRPPAGAPSAMPIYDQAEIYDPVREPQDPWSFAGDGLPPLNGEAVTLMPSGMVLVTGGSDASGYATTGAELYDPAINRWKATTWPMARARYEHTATLLPDGRVLLVGGYTTEGQSVSRPQYPNQVFSLWSGIFDLRGNNGDPTANTKIPRIEHTATLLRTGAVLVVGSAYVSNADSQLLDLSNTENWISTGNRMDRYLHTATLLQDGRVLVAGGFGIGSATTAWLYSPVSTVASAEQSLPPYMIVAALLLLFALVTAGFVLISARLERWGRPRSSEEAEWIDS